jgi:hypothetical protein
MRAIGYVSVGLSVFKHQSRQTTYIVPSFGQNI